MELNFNSTMFLISILCVLIYLWFLSLQVVKARVKYKINPPKITGNKEFEKIYRIQVNTYESTILYLPLFVLVYLISTGLISSIIVFSWLISRIIYQIGYKKNISSRTLGFKLQQIIFFISLGIIIYNILIQTTLVCKNLFS